MKIKYEGHAFVGESWQPKHPARWCILRYLWSAIRERDLFSPRGQLWQWEDHCFTCYMRIRSKYLYRGTSLFELSHQHRVWTDPAKVREKVIAGEADDPFLGTRYSLHMSIMQ